MSRIYTGNGVTAWCADRHCGDSIKLFKRLPDGQGRNNQQWQLMGYLSGTASGLQPGRVPQNYDAERNNYGVTFTPCDRELTAASPWTVDTPHLDFSTFNFCTLDDDLNQAIGKCLHLTQIYTL